MARARGIYLSLGWVARVTRVRARTRFKVRVTLRLILFESLFVHLGVASNMFGV